HRADAIGRNLVALKARPFGRIRVAGRVPDDRSRRQRAEITVTESLGRHGLDYGRASEPLVLPLIIAEEEGAIPDDGAAERAAELILDRVRDANLAVRAARQVEIVARLKGSVVVEFVEAAVKIVRARSSRDVDHRPDRAPEFGVIVAGRDAELLNRLGGGGLA